MIIATWILIVLYAIFTIVVVFRSARQTQSMKAYAIGSRQFSPTMVGLSLAASMTSAATFIINPGLIGQYGISGFISYGLVLPLAAIFSLLILSKKFREFGSSSSAHTMAQWVANRYKSPAFGFMFALASLLLITFIVLICVGLSQVLAQALGMPAEKVVLGVIVFIFGYMMFGGANSMVYTNTVQAILMIIVAIVLLGSGYHFFEDGLDGFLQKLSLIDPALISIPNKESSLFRDYFEIFFTQTMVGIAVVCQPHILTKVLLLKDNKDVNRYLSVGLSVQMLFFLVVLSGLFARLTFPEMTTLDGAIIKPDALISTYVVSQFPIYVGLILIMGLVSAGISTLEGLIQSLSTTITSDIVQPILIKFGKDHEEKRMVGINKLVIIALALISAFLSVQQIKSPNLSVALFAQNGVYAFFSASIMPVLLGLFTKNEDKVPAMMAFCSALLVYFSIYYLEISSYMHTTVKNPAIPAAMAIGAAIIVGAPSYWIRKKYVR